MPALLSCGRQFQWNHPAPEPTGCDYGRCVSGAVRQVGCILAADGLEFQVGVIVRDRLQFGLSRVVHARRVGQEKTLYNFTLQNPDSPQREGVSVFYKDPTGRVFHTYSTYARGIDMFMVDYHYLDLVPKGRDEGKRGPFWVRRHDEYGR